MHIAHALSFLPILGAALWNARAGARHDVAFSDPDLLVIKDAEVTCPHVAGTPNTKTVADRGDVAKVLEKCRAGKFDVFEYNAKYSKICKDADLYNIQPLRRREGSYVVVHRRLFAEASDGVRFNVDFECIGEPARKSAKTLFELLQKADLGKYMALNLVGDEYEAKYCWTVGRSFRKDHSVTLSRLKRLRPKNIKYRTTQCHTNGSVGSEKFKLRQIQPDDYNEVFYAGDVVPAAL